MSSVIEIPQSRWKQWNYQLASRLKWTEAVHPWFGNRCSNSVISETGYWERGTSGTYILGKTSLISQWLCWMWGKMYLFSGYTCSTLSVLGLHTPYVKKKKKRRQVCLNFWHMHTSYELLSCLMDPRMVGICRAFSVATGSRLQNIYHDCIWEKKIDLRDNAEYMLVSRKMTGINLWMQGFKHTMTCTAVCMVMAVYSPKDFCA